MKCPQCQSKNPDNSVFCAKCGTKLLLDGSVSHTKTLRTPADELTTASTFARRYQVIEELGAGGMGRVYKVMDTELDEKVALKLLKPEIASQERTIERFRNELKFARKIAHKHVCRMFDLGSHEDTYFITMEYVPGEDLKSFIRRVGKLSVEKAISATQQVCMGLSEAHRLGVIHRDLKPQNIMIDEEGNVRIMDFGIVRSLKTDGITDTGTMIGTPAYMSPEQVDGKGIDGRSDIYSLGIVMFEMLTGQLPFEGETPISVALKHKTENPPEPKELNSQIPDELSRIILKCLAKDKNRRYQDADEMLADLSSLEQEITERETGLSGKTVRPSSFRKPGKSLLIPGLLVLFLAVVVVGYFLIRNSQGPDQVSAGEPDMSLWENSIAVLPFKDFSPEKDQEFFCDGMTDAIISRLSKLSGLKVISMTSVMSYKDIDRSIKKIGQELDVGTILEGSVSRENHRIRVNAQLINVPDDSHLWSDTFDRELESVFDVQDEISRSIAETLQVKLSGEKSLSFESERPKNMEAYEYYMKGMHFIKSKYVVSLNEDDFKAGVDMFEKTIEIDPDFALAYYGLAWAYEHHYMITGSEESSKESQENGRKAFELNPSLAQTNALMGYVLFAYPGEYDKAFKHLRRALEINPNIGEVNFLVGVCFQYFGLYHQGIKYLLRAFELDPYYFWTPYKLGMCFTDIQEFDKAIFYYEKYFEIAPAVAIYPGRYAACLIKMKRFDQGEKMLSGYEEKYPGASWIKKYRAILLAAKGEKNKALVLWQNSDIYSLVGMKDEALESLRKEIRPDVYPHFFAHPDLYYLYLMHNPFYDSLRDEPRFQELLNEEKLLYEQYLNKFGDI